MDLNSYIVPVVLIVCLCVGYIIKHLIPTDRINRFIPAVVGAVGIVISVWNSGWAVSPGSVVTGLVSGLASTGMHEVFKQFLKK